MRKLLCLVIFVATSSLMSFAASRQNSDSLYKKPLKEVLAEIQKEFGVRLKYSDNMVEGRWLNYADWRKRPYSVEKSLTNVLAPFDMKYVVEKPGVYKIKDYEYPRRVEEEGKEHLEYLSTLYNDLASWEKRKDSLKSCMIDALGLNPMPKKPNTKPILSKIRKYNDYSVQNFALEILDGVYVAGSVYRPLKSKGLQPVIINPNGHFGNGRYRKDQQLRCAMFARMGATAASYDLFAWGESALQFDSKLHRHSMAHTIQTLNGIRILDYLLSLPKVDKSRVGITGGSGGGSQTMLIAAIDDRVTVSIPVVMTSSHFMGGCPCESGKPIHLCGNGTNNAEVAAMFAPRPQLIVSDGKDWSSSVPYLELPFIRKVYGFYGKENLVQNAHFEDEGHDYGPSKRNAVYEFMAQYLQLDINAVKDKSGSIDESTITIEPFEDLYIFGKDGEGLPKNAIRSMDELERIFEEAKK